MRDFALLLEIAGKLFLITSAALRTFLVFFRAKDKLTINFFFSVFRYSFCGGIPIYWCLSISVNLAVALFSFPIFVLSFDTLNFLPTMIFARFFYP